MAIFRGVGGSGDSSDSSFLDAVTAQAEAAEQSRLAAVNATSACVAAQISTAQQASAASASATSASNSASSILNLTAATGNAGTQASYNASTGVLTIPRGDTGAAGSDADVTYTNVRDAGALMDAEIANPEHVKLFNSSDYLQNLVEDTTPQLGGTLNLNNNNITGLGQISATGFTADANGVTSVGNITATLGNVYGATLQSGGGITCGGDLSVSGKVTSNLLEGSEYFNSNLNFYDTATQGGNGTTLSSTAGLSFKFDTNFNDDDGFKVFANGNSTACFTIDNNENITATGVMTVDGRDLSVDGAKIDEAKKIPFSQVVSQQVQGSSPNTIITVHIPSTTVSSKQAIDFSMTVRRYNATNSLKKSSSYNTFVQVMSESNSGFSIGTATYASSPASYHAWYYVSGDKTHLIGNKRGKFATSSTGSNSSDLLGLYYNDVTDRTYFRISRYPNASSVYNNVEVFYSLSGFLSVGTYVSQTGFKTKYGALEPQSTTSQSHSFQEILPEKTSRTSVRIQFDAVSSVTSITTYVEDLSGHVENLL